MSIFRASLQRAVLLQHCRSCEMCPCRSQLPPPCERRAKPQKTTSSPFPRGCLARYSPAGGCEGDEEGFHRVPLTANPAASLKDVRETAALRSPPSPQTPSSEAAAVPDPPRPPCRTGGGAASRGAGRGSAALGKERRPPGKGGEAGGAVCARNAAPPRRERPAEQPGSPAVPPPRREVLLPPAAGGRRAPSPPCSEPSAGTGDRARLGARPLRWGPAGGPRVGAPLAG